jgi:hypothetical protein
VVGDVALQQDSSTAVAAEMPATWDKVQVTIPVLDQVESMDKLFAGEVGTLAVQVVVLVPAVAEAAAQAI